MTSQSKGHRRKFSRNAPLNSHKDLLPEKNSGGLVGRFVSAPLTLKLPLPAMPNSEFVVQPSKVLVNVTIENSSGAVKLLVLPEDTVGDLIKAALVFYKKEKRRPFLKNTDPKCYNLHYSNFALQSLKADEKGMQLGSRNFFLCSKPSGLISSCSSKKENLAMDSAFPWMIFVNLLL